MQGGNLYHFYGFGMTLPGREPKTGARWEVYQNNTNSFISLELYSERWIVFSHKVDFCVYFDFMFLLNVNSYHKCSVL